MQVKRECKHPCCGSVCRKAKPRTRRKPLPKQSRKRQKDNRIYSTQRKKFLTDNPVCMYPECEQPSTDVHHSKGRGKYFLLTGTWKALCREHHDHCELNPIKAKQLGLSLNRLD